MIPTVIHLGIGRHGSRDSDPLCLNYEVKDDLRGCFEAAVQESAPNRGYPAARLAHRELARRILRRAGKTLVVNEVRGVRGHQSKDFCVYTQ